MNLVGKMLRVGSHPIKLLTPISRQMCGYPGGVPGLNMPFRKGMDSPVRFTIFYTVLGILGFGSPFLVVRHVMVFGKSPMPPPDADEE